MIFKKGDKARVTQLLYDAKVYFKIEDIVEITDYREYIELYDDNTEKTTHKGYQCIGGTVNKDDKAWWIREECLGPIVFNPKELLNNFKEKLNEI